MRFTVRTIALALAAFCAASGFAEDVKPLKVLLLVGGCCHDYAHQKDILKKGIEERANATVDIIYRTSEEADVIKQWSSTKPPLPIYGNPDYAKGYDVVIHDECAADIKDPAVIDGVIKPHKEDGIPAVNLHCAMHCYRFGDYGKPVAKDAPNSHWYEYMGLQSTGHGPQEPIAISFVDKESAITKGLEDWITMKEELYNNIAITTGHALAKGTQKVTSKAKDGTASTKENTTVVVWTNEFGPKKTKVFSTTIGHNNPTVQDPRYLDLVTRGMLWACDKLNDTYLKKK